ncbi:MAG: FAD-binding oxidoreductase [Ardenticatenaceae bacterium]|nr:FAD-binding oxidoreductase [Ardenticatenaceae bacterium]
MQETANILIIGGGVIGVSIAYHLAQRRVGRVVLLERDSLASGSTGRSVASIDGLTLRPQAAGLFADGARFFAHCDERLGAPCGFVPTGAVVLAGDGQKGDLETAVSHTQAAGLPSQLLSPDELAVLDPRMVLDGVAAASFTPGAGYADPALTTQAFAGAARRLGVEIRQGTKVVRLLRDGEKVVGVETAVSTLHAPIVIIAAGSWSGNLLRTARLDLPLQPVRHPVVCLRRPPEFGTPHHSLLDLTGGIYARPETGDLTLLGSVDANVGYDPIQANDTGGYVHESYILWALTQLTQRYPSLETSQLLPGWTGVMTITPNWQPIIGGWPDAPGLFCAVGFSGQGFQISPAVGKLLAELVTGSRDAASQLAPFAPTRFATATQHPQHTGENHSLLR